MSNQSIREESIRRANHESETQINQSAVTDLYGKKTSKKERMLNYCKEKGYFSKADIYKWGSDNFYICSVRRLQELVQEGKIKKLSKDECVFRGMSTKMAWYSCLGKRKIY